MSAIATAIVGGAIIAGAGSAIAGHEAAGATTAAANTAAGVQQQALAQQLALATPYTNLGQSAIPTYQALLGIGGGGAPGGAGRGTRPTAGAPGAGGPGGSIEQTLQNLPGYQFQLTQGVDAAKAAAASEGLGLSGNAIQGIETFGSGLADSNYQQYLQDLLAPIQIGQGAAAGQAANIQTGASNLGNIAIGRGNAMAGIDANETAGLTRAAGNAGQQALTYQTLQNLNPNSGAPAGWGVGGQTGDLNYGQQVAAGF
jgi:hypothetical protein